MSGPKVVRVVTREERISIGAGQLAQLDQVVAAWNKAARLSGVANEDAARQVASRRKALGDLLGRGQFQAVADRTQTEIKFLRTDIERRRAELARVEADRRTRGRRLSNTASTVLHSLVTSGAEVPQELAAMLEATRDGGAIHVEESERAITRALMLLVTVAETGGASERELELGRRLGEGLATRTLSEWLAENPDEDDGVGLRIDAALAELGIRDGDKVAVRLARRAQEVAAEPAPQRRRLIGDSLLIELAEALSKRREFASIMERLHVAAAELRLLLEHAGQELAERLAHIEVQQDAAAATQLLAQTTALIEKRRDEVSAVARRRSVLGALVGMGYEVREGMETAWAEKGNVVLKHPSRAGYGVKLSGGGERMQFRAVSFGARDEVRDRDIETIWCSDVAKLQLAVEESGGEIAIERALPAGAVPVEHVDPSEVEQSVEQVRDRPEVRRNMERPPPG